MQKKITPPPIGEGTKREQLATYFLSVPPYDEQTPEQRADYCRKLAELGRVEIREVLDSAGGSRPLVWGNPVPHLQSLLTAAQRLAAGLGCCFFPQRKRSSAFIRCFTRACSVWRQRDCCAPPVPPHRKNLFGCACASRIPA